MSIRGPLVRLCIFAAVTVLATAVLAATIHGFTVEPTTHYSAVFTDATRLLPGDDVRVAGVKVGRVTDVQVYRDRYAKVSFDVRSSVPVTTTTGAQLRYRNLVGQRYLALTEGAGGGPRLRPGATIPMARTKPALDLTVLLNGFKPLLRGLDPAQINKVSYEIVRTLQGEGGTIQTLLASTGSLTSTVASHDQAIGRLIDNFDTVLQTVDARSSHLQDLLTQMSRLADGLAGDREAIGSSLDNINALATATASLLQDARPSLASDIVNIGAAAQRLEAEKDLLNKDLQRFPTKVNAIIRLGQYGSWFNFYSCGSSATLTLPGQQPMDAPGSSSAEPVCGG